MAICISPLFWPNSPIFGSSKGITEKYTPKIWGVFLYAWRGVWAEGVFASLCGFLVVWTEIRVVVEKKL